MKTIKAYRIITGKNADSPRTVVFATDKTQAKLSATLTDAGRYCDCNDIYAERAPELAKLRSRTFPGIAKAMAEQWGGKVNDTENTI